MRKSLSDCPIIGMIIKQLLAILLSVSFGSCSQSSTDRSSEAMPANGVKPLYANRTAHRFSDGKQKDTFDVAVNGESIITGDIDLRIINYQSKPIFSTSFPARALLNYRGLIDPKRDEKIIKNRIDNFFGEAHFVSPVAAKLDLSTMADSTKTAWRTIQTDPTAVCFSYQDSKGGISQIAYSKSLRKVVVLRSSDS